MDNSYSMSGIPQHHAHPNAHLSSMQQRMPDHQSDGHTLPPLSGSVPQYQSYSVGLQHQPVTSTASYAPATQVHHASNLPQLAPHQVQRPPQQMGAYSQAGPYMNMTQSMLPPASTAMAPTLPTTTPGRLPEIHPRPQDGSTLLAQLQQHMPNQMLVPASNPQDGEPTHVVGQQGRRGILPSAPGRAPGSVRSTVPQKDQDGKYPCPHCTKTYQHAKHLKRHLLRHTGDRPYMCKLCKDTFSRSDILKRHFQKCSVRRGVVGDMDHLEGSRAHLQKNRQSIDTTQGIHFLNPVNPSPVYDGSTVSQMGQMMPQQPYPDGMHSSSARNSRSNSIVRPSSSFLENRRSLSALEHISTSRTGYETYSAFSTPGGLPSMLPNGTQSGTVSTNQSPVHNIPNGMPNGHAFGGYGASDAAQNLLQHEGQHTHHHQQDRGGPMASSFHKADVERAQNSQQLHADVAWSQNEYPSHLHPTSTLDWTKVKVEPGGQLLNGGFSTGDTDGDAFSALYTDPSGYNTRQDFGAWDMNDPMENKIAQLITFCITYSNTGIQLQDHQNEARLRQLLTADNVRDFLEEWKHMQGHWPMLHMPTFNPTQANDSILLSMICIGAVYSDKMDVPQVRWLMELVKTAVHRASPTLAAVKNQTPISSDNVAYETEELMALALLMCLFLWHGNPTQRARAREEFPLYAQVARHCGLLYHTGLSHNVKPSVLHQLESAPQLPDSSWDWYSWIEQEKRCRIFYLFYLLDMALTLYFNSPPHFNPSEIHLRLPSDDATWEAASAEDCAKMLGLYGPDAQSHQNLSGSLSPKQPELQAALRSLFDQGTAPKMRETNAYSKFILIHALHCILWVTQRRTAPSNARQSFGGHRGSGSGASTPDGTSSSVASGVTTPDRLSHFFFANVGLRGVRAALEKWKRSWDMDNDIQYSPAAAVSPLSQGSAGRDRLPRVGFCRDGIYFYYLAVQFCHRYSKASATASAGSTPEWQLPPDTRFAYVMDLLKRIKHWMASEHGKTGREFDLGSIGSLDDQYGMEDLTLDMKLLFTRIVPTTIAG